MFTTGIIPSHIVSIKWQDYRGSNTGMVIYYNSEPVSDIPIREIPEDLPSDIIPEPNYESGTYGFFGCKHTKTRASFAKKKLSYLFFMTKYQGINTEHLDELILTGFYHINRVVDAKKLHIRYLSEYGCINEDSCLSLRADEVYFVSVSDAFKITPEILEAWEFKSRVTRQSKIILDKEKTEEILKYFKSKKNLAEKYIEETERLSPDSEDEEEEDDEDYSDDDDDDDDDDDIEEAVGEYEDEDEDYIEEK